MGIQQQGQYCDFSLIFASLLLESKIATNKAFSFLLFHSPRFEVVLIQLTSWVIVQRLVGWQYGKSREFLPMLVTSDRGDRPLSDRGIGSGRAKSYFPALEFADGLGVHEVIGSWGPRNFLPIVLFLLSIRTRIRMLIKY